jgi:hypothetical protein
MLGAFSPESAKSRLRGSPYLPFNAEVNRA